MKKTLCLVLAFFMIFGASVLAACNQKTSETETDASTVPESATETVTATETETEPETETFPPIDGTTDPDNPLFSRYATDGNYYAYLEIYEKNKFSVTFDISARKMTIVDPNGKATVCSYDKNYYLTRIDTPSSVVITIDNTVSEDGLLTLQEIHYRSSSGTREYSIAYTYDEDSRISGMKLVDSHKEETLNTEFAYCGNDSYLIRSLDNNQIRYFHLNYYLTPDPITDVSSRILKNGDREISYHMGPLMNQKAVLHRTSGEVAKMFDEYCLFNAMLNKLSF